MSRDSNIQVMECLRLSWENNSKDEDVIGFIAKVAKAREWKRQSKSVRALWPFGKKKEEVDPHIGEPVISIIKAIHKRRRTFTVTESTKELGESRYTSQEETYVKDNITGLVYYRRLLVRTDKDSNHRNVRVIESNLPFPMSGYELRKIRQAFEDSNKTRRDRLRELERERVARLYRGE